jgi:hypothetical protein
MACASFPPLWNDVVRYELVLMQEGKLTHGSFPESWTDVV